MMIKNLGTVIVANEFFTFLVKWAGGHINGLIFYQKIINNFFIQNYEQQNPFKAILIFYFTNLSIEQLNLSRISLVGVSLLGMPWFNYHPNYHQLPPSKTINTEVNQQQPCLTMATFRTLPKSLQKHLLNRNAKLTLWFCGFYSNCGSWSVF